jgi:hypothetical protein
MKYYFALGSREFLLEKEAVEEVIRERAYYYQLKNKPADFWILPSPEFWNYYQSQNTKKTSELENLSDPKNCVAIVSTNKDFICWIKLRYQNILSGSFLAPNSAIKSPLLFRT